MASCADEAATHSCIEKKKKKIHTVAEQSVLFPKRRKEKDPSLFLFPSPGSAAS